MRDDPDAPGPMVSWKSVDAVPGAQAALAGLRADGFILCVASNAGASDAGLMGQALERVDLCRHFHHLWTSKELGAAKPAARFFSEAARRAGFQPEQCIMVGNDYAKDICGAKSAGLHTIWLAPGGAGEEAAADVVIQRLCDLPAAVRLVMARTEEPR